MDSFMKDDRIEFRLNSWMENAAICGLVNILGEEHVKINPQSVEVPTEALRNFEESYFGYFAEQYQKLSSLTKVLAYEDEMLRQQQEQFAHFDEKAYQRLQKYLTDLKRYGESNSYLAVYPLIDSPTDIVSLIKQVKIDKLKKGEMTQDKAQVIERVKKCYDLLAEIFAYYHQEEVQRYLAAKIQIYSVINNGYNDVSFLNRQESKGDFFEKYHNYFVESMFSYLEEDHQKDKLSCTNCGQPIKKGEISYSFINQAGYDANRKQSNAWGFTNDLFMCPVCRLLYTCIPAGFTYVYNQGIFVNDNHSVRTLLDVNTNIRLNVLSVNKAEVKADDTYAALIRTLQDSMNQQHRRELQDTQVVRYENERYYFNLLPKHILKTIEQSKDKLAKLFNVGFILNGEYQSVYKETITRLMNNTNLFSLIYQIIRTQATGGQVYMKTDHIIKLIAINQNFLKELIQMKELKDEELQRIRRDGFFLKKEYANKNKADSIGLRLLNALKIGDKNGFLDLLLNSYMYLNKQVPKYFTSATFNDEEGFKTIGYSFVAGMIGDYAKIEGGNDNE
ncbi:Cas8a1 family CRISPR/Cas system-associated protein [Enterococcus entomosocium]|uniref:Cas8a1 family CRISPR/Cas system-associated protein n=1 Tax=Enterococcus entomosocium TaxID=3034352 RepID=A0ABV3MD99_9ENTE|nr:Cas8a1 family CRISPR/Cas system-associated protein [Enterococcus casseliflavus]MDB1709325.1 Cas8a1 family CRISPR/Cas system-associated protein [Enterococcus casseliflavus]MDB1716880.1 Cas8a1 family CRISPR/Cas system-associated protein [Enterococcus casseliflavus]